MLAGVEPLRKQELSCWTHTGQSTGKSGMSDIHACWHSTACHTKLAGSRADDAYQAGQQPFPATAMKPLEGPCCRCLRQLGKLHCVGGITHPRQRQQPAEQRAGSCFKGRRWQLRGGAAGSCTGRSFSCGRSLVHRCCLSFKPHQWLIWQAPRSLQHGKEEESVSTNQGFLIGRHVVGPSTAISLGWLVVCFL